MTVRKFAIHYFRELAEVQNSQNKGHMKFSSFRV